MGSILIPTEAPLVISGEELPGGRTVKVSTAVPTPEPVGETVVSASEVVVGLGFPVAGTDPDWI